MADSPRLSLALFLAGIESTIISTTLISITNELGGFQQSSWIVTAYLLGYASITTSRMLFGGADKHRRLPNYSGEAE